MLLATSAPDGTCDVSPRGDPAGFVHVVDERTLLVPERPGNRLADSLRNILANPHVGLLFLVPGVGDTLRVNGRATHRHRRRAARAARRRREDPEARPPDRDRRGVHALLEGVPPLAACGIRSGSSSARSCRRSGEILRSLNADVDAERYDEERAERYARREGLYLDGGALLLRRRRRARRLAARGLRRGQGGVHRPRARRVDDAAEALRDELSRRGLQGDARARRAGMRC